MTDNFLDDLFHRAALAAGFIAHAEGRLADSEYVKRLCYQMYEEDLASKNATKQSGKTGCPMSEQRSALQPV